VLRKHRSHPRGEPLGWVALTSRKARCRPSGKPLIGRSPTRSETASSKWFCRFGGLASGRSGVCNGQCVPRGRGRGRSQPKGLFPPLASGGDGASVASPRAGGRGIRPGWERSDVELAFFGKRRSHRSRPRADPGDAGRLCKETVHRGEVRYGAALEGEPGPLCGRGWMSRKADPQGCEPVVRCRSPYGRRVA
jgi:hypothetical protein